MRQEVHDLEVLLSSILKKAAPTGRGRSYLKLESEPLLSDSTLRGFPLRSVLSPATPDEPLMAAQVFDLFLQPIVSGEGRSEDGSVVENPIAEIERATNKTLARFVARGNTLVEQVTRLLFALGNHPDGKLEIGPNRLLVTRGEKVFGVDGGEVVSRFYSGFEIDGFEPLPHLEKPKPLTIYDQTFALLYREAYGRYADRALVALATGQPGYSYKRLSKDRESETVPSMSRLKVWEKVIMNTRDPHLSLFKHLVPLWMGKTEFTRAFGQFNRRPSEADTLFRLNMLNKLQLHYKNKNKEKQNETHRING